MANMKDSPESESDVPRKRRRPEALRKRFVYYRDKIRKEIDRPMLLKNFPIGTKIHFVIPEAQNQGFILGRPLGSYPVTVKIPDSDPRSIPALRNKTPLTVVVTGAEERSLIGLTWPIQINQLGQRALEQLPGAGKKRASKILLMRPLQSARDLSAIFDQHETDFSLHSLDLDFSTKKSPTENSLPEPRIFV
jgi:radical SAM superfamily enzyme with C-terminal helix-hairpin-helix motif